MKGELQETYQQLHRQYTTIHQGIRKRLNLMALWRLVTFLAGAYISYRVILISLLPGLLVAVLVLALFVYLIVLFSRNKQKQAMTKNLIRINANEIEALRGHVGNFEDGHEFEDPSHAFASDLELFGDQGLFQHINRTSTYAGKNQLASWLLNPLQQEKAIRARQKAIQELKALVTWRQRFMATGYLLEPEAYQDARLIAWSKEPSFIGKNPFFRVFRWVLPVLTLALASLFFQGVLPLGYLLVVLVFNGLVLYRVNKRVTAQHNQVTRQIEILKNYSLLFHHMEKQDFRSQALQDLKARFFSNHEPASHSIRKLSRILDALDNRISPILGQILNLVFLWDIHQVIRLEKWHRHHATDIEQWIGAMGGFDAYISLANFAYNHEDFHFPDVDSSVVLRADHMGHPLIPSPKRVDNPITIREQGISIIVTGANMAGKSTFLRTIGVNLVLAMAGSVVCAGNMVFRITRLFTSMNITDSLAKNESYFYAEIKRLRQLTEHAMHHEHLLVLLDEILTGTNTKDKEKASKAFVRRLLGLKVTSIIATHDLSLTSLAEEHPRSIRNTSFEVELEGERMKFDYKLRDGVARNMNALALLRQMDLI
jgi:DNA mismatch repair ATPase MutS